MPIPAFDWILNILPPHLGDPRIPSDLSPYPCTAEEVCDRFATTPTRKTILDGFLRLREELRRIGISGLQWIGGSFVEDIETQEGRDPHDIDVVTFVADRASPADIAVALQKNPQLLSRAWVKGTFQVDHYWIPLRSDGEAVVENTRYWCSLFSHRRDRIWKGMLRVDLNATDDDSSARTLLRSKP